MSTGSLFVTAPSADAKFVNRLLLHLRDWEYGSEDRFKLITTQTLPSDASETVPPVIEFNNEWAGKSIEDVEKFVLEHFSSDESPSVDLNGENAVILDEQGMRDQTCVLLDRAFDSEPEFKRLDKFNKVRLPWDQTYITWCNLDIANMGFEEFCDEELGDTGDGWWVYQEIAPSTDPAVKANHDKTNDEAAQRRDAALKAMEDLGHI